MKAESTPEKVVFVTKAETIALADPVPTSRYTFPSDASLGVDRDATLTLTEDERLTSLSSTSAGIGPAVVAAAGRLVGIVVGTAVAAAAGKPAGLRESLADAVEDVEAALPAESPQAPQAVGTPETTKEGLKKEILAGEAALLRASTTALKESGEARHSVEANRIERELARLRRLLEIVEARAASEGAAKRETWTETDEAFYFVESLPEPPSVLPGHLAPLVQFTGGTLGEAGTHDMLMRFGVLVCCRDAEPPLEEHQAPVSSKLQGPLQVTREGGIPTGAEPRLKPALFARVPRAVEIAVFAPLNPTMVLGRDEWPKVALKLVSRSRQLVVDERSRIVAVPLAEAGLFGKQALTAKLGPLGGIIELSSSESTTAPAAVVSGLSAVQEGLSSAKDMAEQLGSLSDLGMQREIGALKSRQDIAEMSKALGLTPETDAERLARERDQRRSDLELTRLQLEVEALRMKLEAGSS